MGSPFNIIQRLLEGTYSPTFTAGALRQANRSRSTQNKAIQELNEGFWSAGCRQDQLESLRLENKNSFSLNLVGDQDQDTIPIIEFMKEKLDDVEKKLSEVANRLGERVHERYLINSIIYEAWSLMKSTTWTNEKGA